MTGPVVTVDRLRISFGDAEPVVHDLSLALEPGRILALVGESGSGKTLSAMSIPGLLPPSARVEGSVRFRGQELTTDALRSVRGTGIGVVFQEPMASFTPVLTIGTQIAEALRAHDRRARDVVARIERDLASVGIDDPRRIRTSYPHELSGGQLQRAMIALALAQDPAVLIADEPTTALDVTVQAGVLDLIRSLARDRQLAVLLITHDMGVVADVADDVLVMRRGVEVERGAVREVFAAPRAEYTRELLAAVPDLERAPSCETAALGASERPLRTTTGAGSTAREVVRMRDVSIRYARRADPAVSGIDLEVRAGRTLGLVGESGSGKSTIGRVLAGIVPAASGSVEVDGIDLRTASGRRMRELRSRVGIVFQDPASSLNPRKSIGWSIAEPLLVQSRGSRSSADRDARDHRVAELLTSVRLDPGFASRYPHELSGGQRQRVGIARALALRPALVIADEPTSALDVTVQAAVLDLLRELQTDIGFACLLISHDLAVVRQMADEVVVLHRGRIVERGTTAAVLDDPHDPYTRMLLAAAPVADPVRQAERRDAWRAFAALERAEERA